MGGIITNEEELVEILKALFYDYIDRKRTRRLYQDGITIPKRLLIFYYQLPEEKRHLKDVSNEFLNHYIACESILENAHMKFEKDGLKEMYNYVLSDDINYRFDIYTLLELHRHLYSKAPYPEVGGVIRNSDAHIDGAAIDLTPASNIRYELKMLDYDLQEILDMQDQVKMNPAYLFPYIDKCIKFKCQLIKVHPFADGNGRTVRAFMNKLFIDVGLPMIYISSHENASYKKSMQKAIGEENDYSAILNFYYCKLCDSIVELENSYHSDKKVNPSPKIIMDIVKKVKDKIPSMTFHYSIDEEIASMIQDYLDEKDISSKIVNISFFDPLLEPHAFVVATYPETHINKINKLLIDPLFEHFIDEHEITYTKDNMSMIENLKNNGIIFANQNELYKYLVVFYQEFHNRHKIKQKTK